MFTAESGGGQTVDSPLPPEDIFGNTKKLLFIQHGVAEHKRRKSGTLNVLDFGCGNATGVGRYIIDEGIRYFGIDLHRPSLDYAESNFGGPAATFHEEVPSDVTFDIIVYADILEHVHDSLSFLIKHTSQLADDGIVLGSVPNGYGLCEIEKYIDRRLGLYRMARATYRLARRLTGRPPRPPSEIPYNSNSGHVIWFRRSALQRMFEAAGLEICRWGHAGFVGADLTGSTIFRSPKFIAFNAWIANRLPYWAVSAWYFELHRQTVSPSSNQSSDLSD